jgi:hypothetical protein
MKTARLIVLLVNFAILALVAYAGVKLYFSDFFDEQELTTISDPGDYLPKKPIKERKKLSEYGSIAGLAQKPVEKVETGPPPPEEPKTPTLNVNITSVVYDAKNPSRSGAHVEASGVKRYLVVGDNQNVADTMPYHLKEIQENKPDREWTLIFESEKGEIRQAIYRMQ